MAADSAFSSLHSIFSASKIPSPSLSLPGRNVHFQTHVMANSFLKQLTVKAQSNSIARGQRIVKSVYEETQIAQEEEVSNEQEEASSSEQVPVVVPVSPSDTLTMLFQAEGTMNETAIPTVTKALEETEGITNLKVQVVEGIASVELKKQTTVQATGVASSLIEAIQGSNFKLQTLNLSFDEKEDGIA
ncbi:EG2771 protein [Quillaja saponaria]|uniref:EG2771 protein n=1 Tax=Quillaja saponaria TaxID=32244 RepID=A0AAD7Q479_QUISA|nr:EG2771 protein [Quillaja saponaria]